MAAGNLKVEVIDLLNWFVCYNLPIQNMIQYSVKQDPQILNVFLLSLPDVADG